MAANFWESTQRRNWLFTKEELAARRQQLENEDPSLVTMYPLPEWRHLYNYFNYQMLRLAKNLSIRQQAIATAQVYMKRFYTRVEIRSTNPTLVLVTAVYLACKMEEMPLHIRNVSLEAKKVWPMETPSLEIAKIGECEFWLISEMSAQLIVHQPYRTLTALQQDFQLANDDHVLAVSFLNDHFMTDLPLLYAPHTIALAAIMLALVLRLSKASSSNSAAAGQQGGAPAGSLGITLAPGLSMFQQAVAAKAMTPGGNSGSSAMSSPIQQNPPNQPYQLTPQQQEMFRQQQMQQQNRQSETQAKDSPQKEKSKLQRFAAWLSESGVDIEAMIDCTQELIAFYECQESYNEQITRDQINRFVKARGL
ncbi:RNA polymerase II holoenzyme cyclin-like subunit [Pyricularia grisea]|uniref:RNA polymerase II holoenzyme cyclin-like subunit n=1 Tax=Pyricularia grisea TaxID=148305 RepID=A0A6P8AU73_PYRGI|nr:uncharacterized protein PgNI_08171 [Pyricularia grisea]KAI6350667.1 RNA polymerase II holoenzyme cyclin-like subunit [Pyricularia grisea]TLD05762.1 hypothetical protein PgNI_08171 [Pyricularia grisea]